jgi:hypothetical protein
MWIDPTELKYTIASRYIYDEHREYPRYGILDGSWDQHKNAWKESRVWGGLQQRFEEQKDWEDTTYYRHSMDKLRSGEHVAYLDDRQTVTEFERYLDYLDELYLDIEENGYDPTSIITVHIGRDGEWMVGHGNHRRTIASIIGVESVPVRIKFRHEKWQDRRQRFYDADTVEEIRDADEFLSHPDIPEMTRK